MPVVGGGADGRRSQRRNRENDPQVGDERHSSREVHRTEMWRRRYAVLMQAVGREQQRKQAKTTHRQGRRNERAREKNEGQR